MDNTELEQRIEKLERKLLELAKLEQKLAIFERAIIVTPTKIIIRQSVLINGMMNADRVFTKRTGNHVELVS